MGPVIKDCEVNLADTHTSKSAMRSVPHLRELAECLERKVLPAFENIFREVASLYDGLLLREPSGSPQSLERRCSAIMAAISEPFLPEGIFGRLFLQTFPLNGRFFLQDLVHRGTRGPRKLQELIAGEFRDRDECLAGMNKEFYREWFQEACKQGDNSLLQLEERLREIGVQWKIRGGRSLEQLEPDRRALLAAVTRELCANAIAASGGVPAQVRVDIAAVDEKIRVAVRDRGCGIDEFQLSKLFRPRRRRFGGVSGGSGLPWVKRTIEKGLGGKLATPRPRTGGGTLIEFEVPLTMAGGLKGH